MSDLVVIVFEGRHTADEALLRLQKMSMDWEVDLDEVVVMTRDKNSVVRTRNSDTLTAAGFLGGTSLGALTGTLIGAMAGNPAAGFIAGSAVGAGSGTLAGMLDQADEEDALAARVGAKMGPDSSALAVIGWSNRPTKLLGELEGMKGEVIETSLSVSDEQELRAALSGS
ncbi:DUF1269 domain-containing protein [Shimia thalassica]|uniref:DUF1269 domain-containing protein n=1 Tax=Shimia thalassica TaxID=1715693 RepID=UPI0027336AEA|nr:DUF1269 domain-containing protein [Shimia thalassica]MDP2517732.1 DUF1269 domain-containing protein [Shimia thalassica]